MSWMAAVGGQWDERLARLQQSLAGIEGPEHEGSGSD
jgi:hypothetical protein